MRYESVNIANNSDALAPLLTVETQFIKAAPWNLTDSRRTVVDLRDDGEKFPRSVCVIRHNEDLIRQCTAFIIANPM